MSAPVVIRWEICRRSSAALPLEEHGLRWIHPPASVAHPLDGEPAVLLRRSLTETARGLGRRCARLHAAASHRSSASRTRYSPISSVRCASRASAARWPASGCPDCSRRRRCCARASAARGRAPCSPAAQRREAFCRQVRAHGLGHRTMQIPGACGSSGLVGYEGFAHGAKQVRLVVLRGLARPLVEPQRRQTGGRHAFESSPALGLQARLQVDDGHLRHGGLAEPEWEAGRHHTAVELGLAQA